jgi:hypothetical protein
VDQQPVTESKSDFQKLLWHPVFKFWFWPKVFHCTGPEQLGLSVSGSEKSGRIQSVFHFYQPAPDFYFGVGFGGCSAFSKEKSSGLFDLVHHFPWAVCWIFSMGANPAWDVKSGRGSGKCPAILEYGAYTFCVFQYWRGDEPVLQFVFAALDFDSDFTKKLGRTELFNSLFDLSHFE